MQNFGKSNILSELSNGNAELGEAFAMILNDMVVQSGITNPKAESFEFVPKSWRNLADKQDKTLEDIKKLDQDYKDAIFEIAESYLLFMARETKNTTGKIDYHQYESYLLKYRFGRYDIMNKPEYLNKVKEQIKNAFNKISSHGEDSGDNLIDKYDMASFLYALSTKSKRDDNGNFKGFVINGIITPEEYAVSENMLFDKEENLFTIKLKTAYKVLNNLL